MEAGASCSFSFACGLNCGDGRAVLGGRTASRRVLDGVGVWESNLCAFERRSSGVDVVRASTSFDFD